ncbi:sigma-70 family RNA polymerase sigma factor [Pigmentiphaga aceris]|uniref:Sigma-70 family RNA polymerase sigma factor n=1 Tax=Pigmentiphaga aceris TaxID=1940612 RepID=A0A5C0AY09_9BURK|nr:sigma-70 family RNA polymerase sigma factor [Pigmentiphaga aceris]QEI06454.1 sigma-70 family RNA polymerase sigma factor [Pigmentiphaga aceris]
MATESALHQQIHGIYQDHHGWLQGWLRKSLGCSQHAADLAHDTFLRLLNRTDPVAMTEPRAYLVTIARGLVVDFRRRRALEQAYLDVLASLPEPEHPSPEARAIVLEALVAMDAMLDGMKPAVRQAFLLSQLDGLTYTEIAAELRVSVRTVNNYMLKAIEHCYLLAP